MPESESYKLQPIRDAPLNAFLLDIHLETNFIFFLERLKRSNDYSDCSIGKSFLLEGTEHWKQQE